MLTESTRIAPPPHSTESFSGPNQRSYKHTIEFILIPRSYFVGSILDLIFTMMPFLTLRTVCCLERLGMRNRFNFLTQQNLAWKLLLEHGTKVSSLVHFYFLYSSLA